MSIGHLVTFLCRSLRLGDVLAATPPQFLWICKRRILAEEEGTTDKPEKPRGRRVKGREGVGIFEAKSAACMQLWRAEGWAFGVPGRRPGHRSQMVSKTSATLSSWGCGLQG